MIWLSGAIRIKRLKGPKSEGKVPTGLVVHRINAKGRITQVLQERFDAILKDAELKLLDTTIAYPRRTTVQREMRYWKGERHSYYRCLEEFVLSQRSLSEHRRRSFCRFGKMFRELLLVSVPGDKDL